LTTAQNAILLVGHPNVGKSVLFHRLTGAYVNVSNYPGTTVEVTRASSRFDHNAVLLDTPGIHEARSPLNQEMVKIALDTLAEVDALTSANARRLFLPAAPTGGVAP